MPVEPSIERDTVVTFTKQFASYFAGESAAFTVEEAQHLIDEGVAEAGTAEDNPPVNVDVPYVSQVGDTLTCTMGNWIGVPTAYAYAWQMDGVAVGTDANAYTVTAGDIGKTATCTVTATNAIGSTDAPPASVVVVDPAGP